MPKKEKSLESSLWESANKLRGNVEPSEYKHVVLGLFFLKFACDKYEERKSQIIAEGKEKYVDFVEFYTMKNVFYLKERARWSYLVSNAKQPNIALLIDDALSTIEKDNPTLKGALPDNYYSRTFPDDVTNLSSLLDTVNKIDTLKDKQLDIIGRVYEYFLGKFSQAEGRDKGEYYTPKCIVNFIASLIQPYKGYIYDPCCGSGGMFVQSFKFVQSHKGNTKELAIYGQERTATTRKLARMNLAIRGINADFGEKAVSTFSDDQHKDLKADFVMANPPFNQKNWRAENELIDDPRWNGYIVPPVGDANYAWILNIVSKLNQNGIAGFLLANGALSDSGDQYQIRKRLIENRLVEAIIMLPRDMFYTTDISVTLWILNRNKKERIVELFGQNRHLRDRREEILFMDLRQCGSPYEKKFIAFTDDEILKHAKIFHDWQTVEKETLYKDIPEYCFSATFEDVKTQDFSLVPNKYIKFINRDENIDFDSKMKQIQIQLSSLMKEEEQSKQAVLKVFEDLGYEIK